MSRLRETVWFVFAILMGLGSGLALIASSQSSKPYGERTYLIALALFAFILFEKFCKYYQED
jgi:hypothetical protein